MDQHTVSPELLNLGHDTVSKVARELATGAPLVHVQLFASHFYEALKDELEQTPRSVLDVTHRTVSGRILAGGAQALALHMKAHPAWAGRAVKPRSRKAVREAQGLTARTSPKPSFAGLVVRLALTLSV